MISRGKTQLVHHPAFWIVLGGLLLRLWNINWSLPDLYEEAYPFSVAWNFWTWGGTGLDFNPHFFNYPALTFYLNFAVQALHYVAGSMAGLYPTTTAFSQAYTADPTSFIVLGRLISVLFDAGTIYVAYRLGDEVGGKTVGAIAGILLAVNPLLVEQAHLINVDTPLAFFTLLAIFFLYRLVISPKPKRYVQLGVVAGLAVASKYTGAVVLLAFAILAAVLWLRKAEARPTLREALTTFLWAGIVFHAVNPFSILDLPGFLADVGFERYHAAYGHLGLSATESTVGFYFGRALPAALGVPLMAILAATIVLAVARREWKTYILIAFSALYLLGISVWEMRADRYLMPAIPVFAVLAAWGMVEMAGMIRDRALRWVPRAAVLAALAGVAALVPAAGVWEHQKSHGMKDTRTLARELINKNIPAGAAIVVAPMGLNPGAKYHVLGLPFNPVETERLAPFYDARWYTGFDVAITSDYDEARYEMEPERYRDILAFYRELREKRPLLAEVAPAENQNGPRIRIWDLRGADDGSGIPPELFSNLSRVGHDETVADFLRNLGDVLYAKERLRRCRQVLSAGLTIEPRDAGLLSSMAWTCFRMGEYPAAGGAVDDALEVQPDRPELVSLKGSVLLKLDRADEAEPYFLSALSMNGGLLSAYLDLSEVYTRQGKAQKAIGTLEHVLSLVDAGGPEAGYIQDRMDSIKTEEGL